MIFYNFEIIFIKFDIMVEGYSDFEVLYQRTFVLTIQYVNTAHSVL